MTRPGWENTCEHGLDLASCSKCQVATELAAAEERGRRAGIGQAAKTDAGWRAWNECRIREEEAMRVLAKARYWFAARVLPVKDIGAALIAEIDRALGPDPVIAPRDSGKEPKSSGTASAVFFDGGHLPGCPVVAPSKDRK